MAQKTILVPLFFLAMLCCNAQHSKLWENFKRAKHNNTEPILPDFSYAGYMYSEIGIPKANYNVFNVLDFGAKPNDTISDKHAIVKAIKAASTHGEGIIYFPKGTYVLNTEKDGTDVVNITSSKIVFRGEDKASTTLFFKKDLPPLDPETLWSCPFAIQVKANMEHKFLANIVKDAKRETYSVVVDDASNIKVGDWVTLEVLNTNMDLIEYDIQPLQLNPKWTSLSQQGVKVNERHLVKKIMGDTVYFYEPIHYDVQTKHNWKLTSFSPLDHIGFENLSFEGNWIEKFVHHKNARHDGGWSILNLSGVVNSWINNCRFINVSRCATFSNAAASTAINISIEGNYGHNAINTSGSTGILLAKINDLAGMHHSVGVAGNSTTNTVVWRCNYAKHTSFEAHASQPRCTLFDNVTGGFFQGRAGGAIKNLPNHGRYLVLWNFKEIDVSEKDFTFVATNTWYWRIVPPIIVGFHGSGTTFKEDQVQTLESLGTPVQPASLFEAQLELRLGKLPEWILQQLN